jgi:ubiquinone/menaquinone biosynthesis C-methylase UbiE
VNLVEHTYIPALRFRPLTAWYDFIIRSTIRESTFKSRLIEETKLQPGNRALDLGCGTGTLTLLLKSRYPQVEVLGIDPDPQILQMARSKSTQSGIDVAFEQAFSFALPFPDDSFDCVVSSLVFHHLTRENKLRSLREALRILRSGGHLYIADFGAPQNPLLRASFFFVQLFDGFESTRDNVAGLLPGFIRDSGFSAVTETACFATLFGTIRLMRAQKL